MKFKIFFENGESINWYVDKLTREDKKFLMKKFNSNIVDIKKEE